MSTFVSVRLKALKHGTKQLQHDFRIHSPGYADPSKTPENVVLFGSDMTVEKLHERERAQIQHFEATHNRAFRKDGNLTVSGVITFGGENFSEKTRENLPELDKKAKEFVEKLSAEHGVEPIYLVRHADESTPHYHFQLENVKTRPDLDMGFPETPSKSTMSSELNRDALSKTQDLAGSVFSDLGYERGIKKEIRLEAGEDYASTVHKSVRHFHAELEPRMKDLSEKIEKQERLFNEKQQKIQELESRLSSLKTKELESAQKEKEIAAIEAKIEQSRKTLGTYERRLKETRETFQSLERYKITPDFVEPRSKGYFKKENSSEVALRVNERINKLIERTAALETENKALKEQVRTLPTREDYQLEVERREKAEKRLELYRSTPGAADLVNARLAKEKEQKELEKQKEIERQKELEMKRIEKTKALHKPSPSLKPKPKTRTYDNSGFDFGL